jgi:biotin operon repressor
MLNEFGGEKKLMSQIQDLSKLLELNEYVVEKDIYVTKAIGMITQVRNDYYDLIFQGGTSLAKAHRIVERMSEDCDFRIHFKEASETLQSKEAKRNALRSFRHDLVKALRENGFKIEDESIRVRNEGQFMSIRANYPSSFPYVEIMKPYIALEFFLAEVKTEPIFKPVTTLIRQILGNKIEHPEFLVNSVALIETAAEKWVALTRRVATSTYRKHYRDPNLVRHLYDLYQINKKGLFSDEFKYLVPRIVEKDREQYKFHNEHYYQNPTNEIKRAIEILETEKQWRDDWEQFVEIMVFSEEKLSYVEVLENLKDKTAIALEVL